jgi:TatD DNase family protein
MFIDTHAHVADEKFDADRDAVIARARDAGVITLVEIAESPEMWDAAVQLAESHPFVYASLGIHPHHAHRIGPAEWPTLAAKLRRLLLHPKVVAIGEFGLDYFRMQNTREQQDYLFRRQLELAREMVKPIVIHCREAHADLQKGLAEFYPETSFDIECPRPAGVIHCFSGEWSDAQAYMLRGFHLGFDAPVTYPSSKLLKEVVMRMPLPRMVLETDSPYLPPQTHRGQRNEPAYLPAVAETIGSIKRKTTADVARVTSENAFNLFRLHDRAAPTGRPV